MNKWGIPAWLEKEVKERDKFCVYCGVKMKEYPHTKGTPRDKATFEHIDNDGPPSEKNIVMCCGSCNTSKGAMKLSVWLKSSYCKNKKINKETIADVVRKSLS